MYRRLSGGGETWALRDHAKTKRGGGNWGSNSVLGKGKERRALEKQD